MRATLFVLPLLLLSTVTASAVPITLTGDTWDVSGSDLTGVTWTGSTLVFTSQTPAGVNDTVEGYFDWIGSNGVFGRELFTGTFFANFDLAVAGTAILPPSSGLVLANYTGQVTPDGNQIINGSWSGGVPSNDWSAVRADASPVPEPSTLLLVGVGFAAALCVKSRSCCR